MGEHGGPFGDGRLKFEVEVLQPELPTTYRKRDDERWGPDFLGAQTEGLLNQRVCIIMQFQARPVL